MRSLRLTSACLCLLALGAMCTLPAIPATAADGNAAGDAAAAERTRQTLLYGIDSQVLETLKALKAAWNPDFIPPLTTMLTEKRSEAVQTAVLEIFRERSLREGEEPARAMVDRWQDAPAGLAAAAIRYLAGIHSDGLAARLAPVVDAGDNALAGAAIDALGQAGDSSSAELLLAKLASSDYPDARKASIILALGTLKDRSAVDPLLAIVTNTDEERIRRLYAADSLGKIGDARALPALRDMFAEKEALARQYAAGALARFDVGEVFESLIQGLRDEDAKVRESSARALARSLTAGQAGDAVPILSYKAEMDPVSLVRIASIQALGAIGTDAALQKVLAIYGSVDRPLDSREAALVVLTARSLAGGMDVIRRVIDAEWKSHDTRVLESTARVLSTVRAAQLRDLYVLFLDSPDPVVRSYGARGIALNGMSDLKDRLSAMAEKDPNPGTRKEAQLAAAKL